jgi:excisionase family DNA binding protein
MSSITRNMSGNTNNVKSGALLSVEEAAARLGLRPVTVRQWASARKIARVKLGRRVLFAASEIERLIESLTIPALPARDR